MRLKHCVQAVTADVLVAPVWPHLTILGVCCISVCEILICLYNLEDRGNRFVRNVGTYMPDLFPPIHVTVHRYKFPYNKTN
jgi:hypothetical protein